MDKEVVIVRLFDGNSDSTIREFEREAARQIIAIVEANFPNGIERAKKLLVNTADVVNSIVNGNSKDADVILGVRT